MVKSKSFPQQFDTTTDKKFKAVINLENCRSGKNHLFKNRWIYTVSANHTNYTDESYFEKSYSI
jgi:hypothetical protein